MQGQCEAKHTKHKRLLVNTIQGKFYVYDWSRYGGRKGYCTGQDDVSRTLINTGNWGVRETAFMKSTLSAGDKNYFIDFGSHIGWYSIMAAKLGYTVHAYESDIEHVETLQMNAEMHNVANKIIIHEGWVDKKTPQLPILNHPIELVKSDLEGQDQWAVNVMAKNLEAQQVRHLFVEMSPVFNDSYEALHKRLEDWGYAATTIEGADFDNVFEGQFDLHYEPK